MQHDVVLIGPDTPFYKDLAAKLEVRYVEELKESVFLVITVSAKQYSCHQTIKLDLPIKLQALMQEIQAIKNNGFLINDIFCDLNNRELHDIPQQQKIALTEQECKVLAYLNKRPASRDELLKDVWLYQEGADTRTLETHLTRLRQKLPYLDYRNGIYKINPNIDIKKS